MKKILSITIIVFSLTILPSTAHAGMCGDNYNSIQHQLDVGLAGNYIDCINSGSGIGSGCTDAADALWAAGSGLNLYNLATCCLAFPLLC